MGPVVADILQVIALVGALVLVHRPFGDYMAAVFTSTRHLRAERWIYRLVGVRPDARMPWTAYLRGVLAFSAVGVVFLYVLQRVQNLLPLSLGFPAVPPDLAFDTAASFVSNTNWQSYAGESTMGHVTQTAGLAVQNFLSSAVGIAVAIALVRAFAVSRSDGSPRPADGSPRPRAEGGYAGAAGHRRVELGNFWVDLVRGVVRILVPVSVVAAVLLVAAGAVQNFGGVHEITTLTGSTQHLPPGAVASQEAIKDLGTNGGGYFNANSAHPYENPGGFSNLLTVFLLLVIPFSLPRTFATMVGSPRQGVAIVAAMGVIWCAGVVAVTWLEYAHPGTASQLAGGATEGKEQRFGEGPSSLFAVSTTMTSTGSVNSSLDSFGGLSGGVLLLGMMLGEIAPGGTGSGLYGMLVMAVVAVFVAGLMVGRTPEYLGRKIGTREMKLAACTILITPALVLAGAAVAMALPDGRAAMANTGPHGFSEVLYASTSAANNNGSAFAGLSADTPFFNTTLGLCMLLGRFLPMVFVLALAGSLAGQRPVPVTAGTLHTGRPLFSGLLVGTVLIVTGLTFFPALALGPLAEGLTS